MGGRFDTIFVSGSGSSIERSCHSHLSRYASMPNLLMAVGSDSYGLKKDFIGWGGLGSPGMVGNEAIHNKFVRDMTAFHCAIGKAAGLRQFFTVPFG